MTDRRQRTVRRGAPGWLAAMLVLAASQMAQAQGDSGFLRGEGNLDLVLSYGLDTYDEFWIGDSKVTNPPFGRVTRQYFTVYGAYGITDSIDLTLNAAYVHVDTDAVFNDEDGLQDLAASAKMRFIQERFGSMTLNVLAAPGVKVPMTHYEDNSVPAIGDGQVDLRLRGIIQLVHDSGAFIALETGYDVRFDAPHDEVPINLTAGITFDRITLSGFVTRIESLGGHDIGQGSFPGVEEEYWRVGGGVYCRLTETLGITASGWTTLDGRNTGDVDGFSAGVVLSF